MRIAFLGFGEAAKAFLAGLTPMGLVSVAAFDIKTQSNGTERAKMLADYVSSGVDGCESLTQAVRTASAVFSLVTADQAFSAAEGASRAGINGRLFFDCNSCSPETKRKSAQCIETAGGRYVDVAIMGPVYPRLHRTPILVSGPNASAAKETMDRLNMNATELRGPVGAASAIKLCRSIMVKGLEALTAETLLAARKLGVEGIVLDSLEASHPGFGWRDRSARALERMIVHGQRRSAEMAEVCDMLNEIYIPNGMARATVEWQRLAGQLEDLPAGLATNTQLDAILGEIGQSHQPGNPDDKVS